MLVSHTRHLGRVQQLTGLTGTSVGPAYVRPVSCWTCYPVEQNGSDCQQTIRYVFDNRFRTTSVTSRTIGQLRYTYIDQNLQLHVINTFQFTNSSRTTKQRQL